MAAHSLRLWLSAPLQSWGTSSRFDVRATDPVPSKSGVIGLACAALGRPRGESIDDLAALRFGVRIERPGTVVRDFQTAGAGTDPVAVASGARSQARGAVSERYYLADAAFVAAFEGDDEQRDLLGEVAAVLAAPRWLLGLGRRSCPPVGPMVDAQSLVAGELKEVLAEQWWPGRSDGEDSPGTSAEMKWRAEAGEDRGTGRVELRIEVRDGSASGGAEVHEVSDEPLGIAFEDRTFANRRVGICHVPREGE